MGKSWVPRILRPDFTWPRSIRAISEETPAVPKVTHPLVRRFWGLVHRQLLHFSYVYASWFGLKHLGYKSTYELPFGLILKWAPHVRIEEVIATQWVLCYGETPGHESPVSILMTRLPGKPPSKMPRSFDPELEVPWVDELARSLKVMRTWRPNGWSNESRICSVMGTRIQGARIPLNKMGPFETERELHDYLLSACSSHGFESRADYDRTVVEARKILTTLPHRICFTHGDLHSLNILIDEHGSLSGFLDWDSAGWYPEYWEFTTIMRRGRGSWWWQVLSFLGGNEYLEEMECDRALDRLTVDSYS
ncbi:uncharacterized protein PV07_08039 [Cladophialophora immunda]|uniref:Aminoglycoside phosphotransferase domain-containing protein n=1 Tax=Cladophialophora immunda TaxID=569365 RepID=A0A0D2CXN4_9EURO|nr:uncharacterized protein PV07_08039 [Cladophialophora immunda]KIW28369.1 hypothetical protein PV07_08039 [Cladophialophora immunda]